jgi:NAD-dependent deacetylase
MSIDNEKIAVAVQRLLSAKSVVILTGAGISKESGIPTYRDPLEGIWTQYDPQEMATVKGFAADPKRGWEWHEHWRTLMIQTQPNSGHHAIVDLESLLSNVVVLTQNIDRLHQSAGSKTVIELHGTVHEHKCFANCQGNPTLIDLATLPVRNTDQVPLCPHCGSWVRPNTVWFEELLADSIYHKAISLVDSADVLITVGTSGVVMPAANFPYRAKRWNDAFVIDVNPNVEEITAYADVHLAASAGIALPLLVDALRTSLPARLY